MRWRILVNSYYDGQRGHTVHETYKSYGTGKGLINSGVKDIEVFLNEEVKKLNYEKKRSKVIEISEVSPFKYGGHFLIKAIIDKLSQEKISFTLISYF